MNTLADWIFKQMREARVRSLVAMPTDDLKALWDQYDGCNAPGGYEGEDIHLALNLQGHGAYCAI